MYHIVVNPASRSGKGKNIWEEIVRPSLKRENIQYKAYLSSSAGDIEKIMSHICENDLSEQVNVIVLGGDGTLNEALQGLTAPERVVIGYIPTGSSNDFARDIAIPSRPSEALDLILHTGKPVKYDLGVLTYEDGTKRYFKVSCGIGYDATVCEEVLHSKMKNVFNKVGLGKLTYGGTALKQLFVERNTNAKLYLDDAEPIELKSLVFIANMIHRYEGGGFMFAPNANPSDGILDLCVASDLSTPAIIKALPTAMKGEHFKADNIDPYTAKKVRIETSEPCWVHTDGEVTRKSSCITVEIVKEALTIMTK